MAGRFCLQDPYWLDNIFNSRYQHIISNTDNDQFSGDQCSNGKPCEKFENRITLNGHTTKNLVMFRNYLTTAIRNIVKKKGYSFLNIFGLTIGMSCCLLIFHYVSYERSYDDFVP